MVDGLVYGGLVLSGALYAVGLEFAERKWQLVSRKTWLSVVIGVVIILAWVALVLDFVTWCRVCFAFVACGSPVILRSVIRETIRERNLERAIKS
jgi:hypothetical protein